MANDLVVVFGGSGFVGKQVVRALAKRGKRVRVAMRRPHLGADLSMLGDVGQIQIVQANVRYPDSVNAALVGADAVVNLVAVLHESGAQTFQALHVEAARTIANAAAHHVISRLVHVSALGAGPKGARYARTKLAGEQAVRELVPTATILRPSLVFGSEDQLFNRFGKFAQTASAFRPLSGLPMFGGGKTRFQPIFVGDVADAICAAIDRDDARGRTYELGGPAVYTFKQLMQIVVRETARAVPLISIPFFIGQPLGLLIEWAYKLLPFAPPLTGDQVIMLKSDNIVGADPSAATIADLGVTSLESVEAIVPTYMWRFRPYGQFQTNQTA